MTKSAGVAGHSRCQQQTRELGLLGISEGNICS